MNFNVSFNKNEIASITKMATTINKAFATAMKTSPKDLYKNFEDFDTTGKNFFAAGTTADDGSKELNVTIDPKVIDLLVPVIEVYAGVIEDLVIAGMAFMQVAKRGMKTYISTVETFISKVK